MDISAEQAERWPKSKVMEDAFVVYYAVVYECPDGLRVTLCNDAQAANELEVAHQMKGHRAWMVTLEGEGLLVHAD